MSFSCKKMSRPRSSGRQRIAQLSEDCILLSSDDSDSELPNRTFDLTNEIEDVVDLTAVADLSVIVIDSPSSVQRRQRTERRRRRSRSISNSRPRQSRTSRSESPFITSLEDSNTLVTDFFEILPDRSAKSGHLSNEDSSPEQSVSRSNYTDGTSIDNQICPLCLETYKEIKAKGRTLVSTTCGHVFCKGCALKCVNSNCPTCRKKLTAKSIHPLYL